MKINDEYIVEIEKLTNLGGGLCKIDGFVIFIKDTCPQDKVKIKITKVNKNFATGKLVEIIEPSPYRIKPMCPMQKICGACQLQFIDYNYQLEIKRGIVEETIRNIAGIDISIPNTIASPEIKNYRHKIQYPISETKNSKRILAGYYKPETHEIVNIKYCPIQPEECDEIIEFIRQKAFDFGISGYIEKKHSGDLRHVVIRSSAKNNDKLIVLVVNATKTFEILNDFAKCIFDEFSNIKGVCVNFNSKKQMSFLVKKQNVFADKNLLPKKYLIKLLK